MSASAHDLFGTDEPVAERRAFSAGRLTAILEEGNLRTIRFAGVEVVRAINYLVRDGSWGTYKAELSDIRTDESASAFEVTYNGLCRGPEGSFSYRMKITGDASGTLVMEARGTALSDFPTNRTGFVVLHPAEAAGERLTVLHSDGGTEETFFPRAISPDQPAFDIAALTHEPAPGFTCTVEMEGDAFEMEDQRNWTDASFKTYIRPLSKPRPYVIASGATDVQRITLSVRAPGLAATPKAATEAVLRLGGPAGHMPSMALFLDPDDLPLASANASRLGPVQDAIVRFDARRGHDAHVLAQATDFSEAIGARLAIEAVLDAIDPEGEARTVEAAIRSSGAEPGAILISPRREFKTRPSNTLPPGEAPISALVDAFRANGITAGIGAGTPSFFTEFNRNPPTGGADFAFFGVAANVHAADDASVMETIGVYPAVIESARRLCPDKPIWLGPCTIGMRHNPYGADVAANSKRMRVPAAGEDPRHGALFGAAFVTGIAAQAAAAAVDRLIVASPTGRFGLLDAAGRRVPLQAVHAELAAAAGAERHAITIDHPGVAAVAFRAGQTIRILIANLTADAIPLALPADVTAVGLIDRAGALAAPPPGRTILEPYRTMVLARR